MEGKKYAHVLNVLSSSPSIRSILSYRNIEEKLRSGIYSRNVKNRLKNIAYLRKTEQRLTRKIDKGKSIHKKGDKAKVKKIRALLPLLEEIAENGNGNGNGNGNRDNNDSINNSELNAERRARAECMEELMRVRAQFEEVRHLLAVSTRRELEMLEQLQGHRDEIIRSREAAADSARALVELQRRCNSNTRSANRRGHNNDPTAPNTKGNTRRKNK